MAFSDTTDGRARSASPSIIPSSPRTLPKAHCSFTTVVLRAQAAVESGRYAPIGCAISVWTGRCRVMGDQLAEQVDQLLTVGGGQWREKVVLQ